MESDHPDIDSVFLAAIELPESQRAAYLDEACSSNASLRARVERLLQAQTKAASFLESPAAELNATLDQPVAENLGSRIGPYKLLQQIGEGGFGVVYMAEQMEPVRRRVALKIIKPGMDTQEVIARFEAERQALAMMDHPNIARVLDAGATESGRPFFVMELVKGESMTSYCDHHRLSIAERLQLFVPVCQAIQHAHQKGIIHRDIKPSNVLVCLYDGQPMPKVIDFGVAKAIQQPLVQRTLFTQFGQLIGTLEYMSPEQAELNQLDVDTRSDIYSLGVLLYELLTGTTPLTQERMRKAALVEMLRMIRETDPERPSARLSHSGKELTKLSSQRRCDPEKLPRLMSGELDWIVVKALEKDRRRRYATAADLARDVECHLHDEPVEACPPSFRYRMGKFVRRHRTLLTTAAAMVLLLTLGATVSTWQAVRAVRAELRAVQDRDRANKARQLAQDERDRAVRAENDAVAEKQKAIAAERRAKQERDNAMIAETSEAAARRAAEMDRQAKTQALLRAEGLRMTAQSSAVLPVNPARALLLAIEGAQRGPRRAVHNNALLAAMSACHEEQTLPQGANVYLAAVSPDGKQLLCCSPYWIGAPLNYEDHRVRVWDLESGRESVELTGHHLSIASADFSPDGSKVVLTYGGVERELRFSSGAVRVYTSRVARVWDLATGNEVAILRGHVDRVLSAEFSSDGSRILTSSYDGARVWDSTTGEQLLAIPGSDSSLITAGFLGDGKRIFTAPSGGQSQSDYSSTTPAPGKIVDPVAGVLPPGVDPNDRFQGSSSSGSSSHTHVGMKHVLQLWDSRSGEPLSQITLPEPIAANDLPYNELQCFAMTSDGEHFFAYGAVADTDFPNRRAAIWQTETGKLVTTLPVTRPVRQASFSPDGTTLLTMTSDPEVSVWDTASGEERFRLKGHQAAIATARYSRDGRTVVTASEDKTARTWDAANGQSVAVFRGHDEAVSWADFADGGRVVTASVDGTARVWRRELDRQFALPLTGHAAAVNMIRFRADGARLVSASDDKSARIWDSTTGKSLRELKTTPPPIAQLPPIQQSRILGSVRYAAFDPTGRRVLTVAQDRIVRLRDLKDDTDQRDREKVFYTPARLWDAESGEVLQRFGASQNDVHMGLLSPDGSRALTVESQQRNETLVDIRDERLVSRGERSGGRSDQKTFVRIYDTASGKPLLNLPHTGTIISAAFSPDGRSVLTANRQSGTDPYATMWDASTGKSLFQLRQQQTNTGWAVFGPNGDRLLTMDSFGARLWDARSGDALAEIKGVMNFIGRSDYRAILCTPFSPDGQRLVLPIRSSHAGSLALWDIATAQQVVQLVGHRAPIYWAEFSPDGKWVVTASEDATARIWDAATGVEWLTLSGHEEAVRFATFSPDSTRVATASADGTARIWLVDPLAAAAARKPRDLTADEHARFEIPLPEPQKPNPAQ